MKIQPNIGFSLLLTSIGFIAALNPYPVKQEDSYIVHEKSVPPVPLQLPGLSPFCNNNCYENKFNISFVCGSDGVTYLNLEQLECVRKACQRDILLQQYGRCQTYETYFHKLLSQVIRKEEEIQMDGQRKNDADGFQFISISSGLHKESHNPRNKFSRVLKEKKVCIPDDCMCNDNLKPICGSDSITYGNDCLLECNKKCHPDISKSRDGHCGKVFVKSSCVPNDCLCPDDIHPVCGSDHVTYANKCVLECNKNCSPGSAYLYDGYCGRLFFPSSLNDHK